MGVSEIRGTLLGPVIRGSFYLRVYFRGSPICVSMLARVSLLFVKTGRVQGGATTGVPALTGYSFGFSSWGCVGFRVEDG